MAIRKYERNNNNLAIAYARYSSHNQNDASVEQQLELAYKYSDTHGYKIVREYVDRAISGTEEDRPDFQRMLSEVKMMNPIPSVLILWKSDRFGRDLIVSAVAKNELKKMGCFIEYTGSANMDDTPQGRLYENMTMAMDQFYSENLAQNIKRGIDYNAEHCLWNGQKTFGYKKGVNKEFVIDEEKAAVVQMIFEEYVAGAGKQEILAKLQSQGIMTATGKTFSSINSITRILNNRTYIGEYHYGEHIVPNGIPAIISEELFNRAREMSRLYQRKGNAKKENLNDEAPRYWLTGKVFCGECGRTMHGHHGTSKTKEKHYYYGCLNHRKYRNCDKTNIRKEVLEDGVVALMQEALKIPKNLDQIATACYNEYKKEHAPNEQYIRGLRSDKKTAETGLENLLKAVEAGIFNHTTQERMLELQAQIKKLDNAIKEAEQRTSAEHDYEYFYNFFAQYAVNEIDTLEIKERILKNLINYVEVHNDYFYVVCGNGICDKFAKRIDIPYFDSVSDLLIPGAEITSADVFMARASHSPTINSESNEDVKKKFDTSELSFIL